MVQQGIWGSCSQVVPKFEPLPEPLFGDDNRERWMAENKKREVKPRVRFVPIAQLVLDERNANKGTKRGRELFGESLEKYGRNSANSILNEFVDIHTLTVNELLSLGKLYISRGE
jgi:hypothetical protein